jgi:hypothetical protein
MVYRVAFRGARLGAPETGLRQPFESRVGNTTQGGCGKDRANLRLSFS